MDLANTESSRSTRFAWCRRLRQPSEAGLPNRCDGPDRPAHSEDNDCVLHAREGLRMIRPSEDELGSQELRQKLSYRLQRVQQLLEAIPSEHEETNLEVRVTETYSSEQLVMAVEQALSGFSLSETVCSECERTLTPAREVSVRARRPLGVMTWYLDDCVCPECGLELEPKPDSFDALVSAQVTSWDDPEELRPYLLADISIREVSAETQTDVEQQGSET